jgi:hypothetical protein
VKRTDEYKNPLKRKDKKERQYKFYPFGIFNSAEPEKL